MIVFAWERFLDLADELAASEDEASLRTAVSRAYYAAFHAAKAYVISTDRGGQLTRRGEDHDLVWKLVPDPRGGTRQELQVAAVGQRLRPFRRWADYEIAAKSRLRESAQMSVSDARRVVNLLAAMVSGT